MSNEIRRMSEEDFLWGSLECMPSFLRTSAVDMLGRIDTLERLINQYEASRECEMEDVAEGLDHTWRCSGCGFELDASGEDGYPWAYCPSCGRKVVRHERRSEH